MLSIITCAVLFGSSLATPTTSGACGDAQVAFNFRYLNSLAGNSIMDFNAINVGETFSLPDYTCSIETGEEVENVTIQEGDSLSQISEKYYFNIRYSDTLTNYYLIQSNDTLTQIAAYYVTEDKIDQAISDLVELNSIEDPDIISEGVILVLPDYFIGETSPKGKSSSKGKKSGKSGKSSSKGSSNLKRRSDSKGKSGKSSKSSSTAGTGIMGSVEIVECTCQ